MTNHLYSSIESKRKIHIRIQNIRVKQNMGANPPRILETFITNKHGIMLNFRRISVLYGANIHVVVPLKLFPLRICQRLVTYVEAPANTSCVSASFECDIIKNRYHLVEMQFALSHIMYQPFCSSWNTLIISLSFLDFNRHTAQSFNKIFAQFANLKNRFRLANLKRT